MEIAKLVISALTPIVVAILGWRISRTLKEIEQKQWASRKLVEKRIEIYDRISPQINRLFCYYRWIGDWKKLSPLEIIDTKRDLDHLVYIYRYLLDDKFFEAYSSFMDALFLTYNGAGEDARLRTHIRNEEGDRAKSTFYQWAAAWEDCFDDSQVLPLNEISRRYEAVMQAQKAGIFSQ
ncbi:hypothetical protein [Mesorhizobium sp. M0244]|uniref:hypothetical protein n=1 Tax=Mesorhizobium sp. M0244 TaxID=2956926 RepID=UPI003334D76A